MNTLWSKCHLEKKYQSNTDDAIFGTILPAVSMLYPLSSVGYKDSIHPLQVAVLNTPYVEVIQIMLNAGANISHVLDNYNIDIKRVHPEVIKFLIKKAPQDKKYRYFASYTWDGNKEMVNFCLDAGISAMCLEALPLKNALLKNQTDIVTFLFSRGTTLEDNTKINFELLNIVLNKNNTDNFWLLVNNGLDYSAFDSKDKKALLLVAVKYVHDKSILSYLLKTLPVNEKKNIEGLLLNLLKLAI